MRALDRFITATPPGLLYHYTDAAGLIGIIESGCLWASDYRHLNDRKEYLLGAQLLRKEIDASQLEDQHRVDLHNLVANTQKTCYVLSFSERRDQLSQWRAYCPSGNGYSLGFGQHNALFQSAKQRDFNLVRCVYDHTEQRELCQSLVSSFPDMMAKSQNQMMALAQEQELISNAISGNSRFLWSWARSSTGVLERNRSGDLSANSRTICYAKFLSVQVGLV
jgi:hypothetical protein